MTVWLHSVLSLARHGLHDTVAPWLVVSLSLHAGLIAAVLPDREGEERLLNAGSAIAVDIVIVEGPAARSTTATGETGDLAAKPDMARKAERRAAKPAAPEPVSQSAPPTVAEETPLEDAMPAPPPPQSAAITAKAPPATAAPARLGEASGGARVILAPRPRRKPAPPPAKPGARPKPGPVTPSESTAHAVGSKPDETSADVAVATPGASAPSGGSRGASPQPGNPKPVYPYGARRQGRQGRVVLHVEVLPDGVAGAVTIDRSSGYASLDDAAVAAVRNWRFRPALHGGTPVAANVRVPIRFRLR